MEKRLLYAPIEKISKGTKTKYRAILTDTSVDREGEIVGKKFMEKAVAEDWLPAHSDHTFSVDNLVAKWINKELKKVSGHHTLFAEAEFFSTEKAKNVKLLLDEGANMGVSIAALPNTEPIEKKIGEETYMEWPDGEILSADFVTIPANKHAHALRIAKSFSFEKQEDIKQEEERMNEEQEKILRTLVEDVKFLKEEAEKPKEPEPLPPAPGEAPAEKPEPAKAEPEPAKEPEKPAEETKPEKPAEKPVEEEKKSLSREEKLRELDKNIPTADQPGVDKNFEPTTEDFIKVQKRRDYK